MKINGALVKKVRLDMGVSQEILAEQLGLSPRQIQRIEAGDTNIDMWQFISVLELLGHPTEDFWLLYLEADEYEEYRTYKYIKRLLRDRKLTEAKGILLKFEESLLSRQSFIRQFITQAKIKVDKEMPNEKAVEKLLEAMYMSKPDFDESKISEYRLTYNEISIIIEITGRLSFMDEIGRAIALIEAVIESRKSSRTSEEDRAALFPALMSNLSTMLGNVGRYKESLKVCHEAIEICREYNNLRLVPIILHNIASGHYALGEEEQIYKPYLVRAYHCAYAIGSNKTASAIKKDAEENFGVIIT